MPQLKQFLDSLNSDQLVDRLNLALDGASLGIWDWDLRDNSVQFDRRWCEMLGLDHASTAMELKSWEERVHPDDLADCYADITAYLNGETEVYENVHRMRHANGEWVYILDRGRISGWDEDGNAIRFTGTHFDCTATERARHVLEQQQDLLEEMIRNLPTSVAMFDLNGAYVAASDEWLRLYDVGNQDYVGMVPGRVGLAHPDSWGPAIAQAIGGERVRNDSDRVELGGLKVLRWTARPWHSGREIAGVIIHVDDITSFVQDRQRRERESRLSVLGLMAGGVAHELNSPLQTILLNGEMIAQELGDPEMEHGFLVDCTSEIVETTKRMARIIQALRTMSRDGSNDPRETTSPFDVVRDIEELCATRIRGRGVSFDIELDLPEGSVFSGRASDVGQILLNLLSNALDAVEECDDARIGLDVFTDDHGLHFRVVDSGPGIPDEMAAQLMTPFSTSKPPGRGSGLGLAISQGLAEAQGAVLNYVPDAPQTTFVLTFPRVAKRVAA